MAYPPAKHVFSLELDPITKQLELNNSEVGVWILSESEAQMLCDRNLPTEE